MALELKNIFRPIPVHSLALKLSITYAVIGGLWILFSDKILEHIATEIHNFSLFQTIKGWFFVLATSALLYFIVTGYLRRLAKTQLDLIASEETFAAAFQYSPESISISRLEDGVYIDVNEGFTDLTGYRHDEVVGKSVFDLDIWVNLDDRRLIAEKLKSEKLVHGMETEIRSKNGVVKPCLMSASVIVLHGQKSLMAITKDVSDRKRIEAETARFNRELAEKNKELESIIYIASHDLRSALVNIQGFSKELIMAADRIHAVMADPELPPRLRAELKEPLEEGVPEAIDFITNSTTKIDSLLTGLLRLSHISREPINVVEISAHELVARAVKELEFELGQSGASLTVGTLPPCLGDKSQIYLVFFNLIKNALAYLDPAKPGIIKVTGAAHETETIYCIEDNGIGIAPEYQDKIFELFHRLNPNETTGEGIGLTVVRRIVERNNGRVWLESTSGQGSRFYAALPAPKHA